MILGKKKNIIFFLMLTLFILVEHNILVVSNNSFVWKLGARYRLHCDAVQY